jgi:hypothetical protein
MNKYEIAVSMSYSVSEDLDDVLRCVAEIIAILNWSDDEYFRAHM